MITDTDRRLVSVNDCDDEWETMSGNDYCE